MPRRPLTLIAILLLAIAATIASAWVPLLIQDTPVAWGNHTDWRQDNPWPLDLPADWPAVTVRGYFEGRAHGITTRSTFSRGPLPDDHPNKQERVASVRIDEVRSGWPARALRTRTGTLHHSVRNPPPPSPIRFPGLDKHLQPQHVADLSPRPFTAGFTKHRLPIDPLPLGFAANTAFYFTLIYAALAAPVLVRRARRAKHNHCPTCGYDLSNTPARCPECGRPTLPPQRGASP